MFSGLTRRGNGGSTKGNGGWVVDIAKLFRSFVLVCFVMHFQGVGRVVDIKEKGGIVYIV